MGKPKSQKSLFSLAPVQFRDSAIEGRGVFDTLNTVSRMVLVREFGQAQEART